MLLLHCFHANSSASYNLSHNCGSRSKSARILLVRLRGKNLNFKRQFIYVSRHPLGQNKNLSLEKADCILWSQIIGKVYVKWPQKTVKKNIKECPKHEIVNNICEFRVLTDS